MKIKIGSRKSNLAVQQAHWVGEKLKSINPGLEISYIGISTQGDRDAQGSLQEMGGKGVFVKEIEQALLSKEIDLAVHSLKDVPQNLPAGLILGPYPEREDYRDAFISRFGEQLRELPRGSTIGTSSPRRKAQILNKYGKKYNVVPIRGNVETRLRKLDDGEFDAIIMAVAGLKRLGLNKEISEILDPEFFSPALGQGCLGLELRLEDEKTFAMLETVRDQESDIRARAERAFLEALGGDCMVPLAGYSSISGNSIIVKALIWDLAGVKKIEVMEKGDKGQAELIGAKAAGRILYEGGSEILLLGKNEAST